MSIRRIRFWNPNSVGVVYRRHTSLVEWLRFIQQVTTALCRGFGCSVREREEGGGLGLRSSFEAEILKHCKRLSFWMHTRSPIKAAGAVGES